MRIFFRDVLCGVKNLIKWIPLIWKDRSWDYQFILKILRKKIQEHKKYFKRPNHIINDEDNNKIVKQLAFCERILDRLTEDDYVHPEYKRIMYPKFEKRYEDRYLNEECWIEVEFEIDGKIQKGYELKDERSEEEKKEESRLVNLNYSWERHWKERDLKLIGNLFAKYLETWWD